MSAVEPATSRELVNVRTGERLPATVENAAAVIEAARAMKDRVQSVIADATDYLRGESVRLGVKTLRAGGYEIALSGGASTEIDPVALREALSAADCPEERIDAAIVAEVTYKVNRSVLRQLAGANPDYAAAIELATRAVEKPYRASVKA